MIKKGLSLLIIILLLTLVTGCGSNNGSEDRETTIRFMHSSVEQERLAVINKLVEKFEKENPTIKIKQIPVQEDSFNTKVVTLASAGELPEVIEVGQDYAKVMDQDQLIDKNAVERAINKSGKNNYYEGALNLVKTEDGKNYTGLPISGWVQGIWYNKEMLASKGFDEPKNWNEVMEIAKAFTDGKHKKYGIALPTAESTMSEQSFSQFALSNGANILNAKGDLNLNSTKMKESLSYYKKLAHYTMPGSNDTTEIKDAFMNGTVPMAIYSTYILPAVYQEGNADNIGFAIPTQEKTSVFGTVSALTVSSGLENKEKKAAEKFLEFMSKPENTTNWVLMSPGGAQPVNKKVTENKDYQSNKVVKSFGNLSNEIAASFNKIQAFGLVDGKNFSKTANITSSGALPRLVNETTVGNKKVKDELQKAETAIQGALEN